MKYLIVTLSTAALMAAVAFVAGGYFNTRRVERKADELRAAVHSMTQQDLAAAIARCDAPPDAVEPRNRTLRRDAAYCENVAREMDDRPLEIVNRRPPSAVPAPH